MRVTETLDALDATIAAGEARRLRRRDVALRLLSPTPFVLGERGTPMAEVADGRLEYGFTLRQVRAMRARLSEALREHAASAVPY